MRSLRSLTKTLKAIAQNGGKAFLLSWEASPTYTLVLVGLALIQGMLPLGQVWVLKLIIDEIVSLIQGTQAEQSIAFLGLLIALQVLFWILDELLGAASQGIRTLIGDKVQYAVTYKLTHQAAQLDLSYYDDPEFYNELREAMEGVRNEPIEVIRRTIAVLQRSFTVFSMGVLIFRLHGFAPLFLFAVTIPRAIAESHYIRRSYSLFLGWSPEIRKMRYFTFLLTDRGSAKEIRLFGLKDHLLKEHGRTWNRYFQENKILYLRYGKISALTGGLSALTLGILFAYVVLQAIEHRITLGDVTLYLQAIRTFQSNLSEILVNLILYYGSYLYMGRFFAFLSKEPRLKVRLSPEGMPRKVPRSLHHGIEFRNVSFRYPGSERDVLQGISFSLRPGETVALVGENGAGKTTLVKLLVRLYDPTEGEILLDGVDLREYDLDGLYRFFGVIFQDFVMYLLTVRENIGFGQIEYLHDQERIRRAAQKAGAESFIQKLPYDYETILGRLYDHSTDLSVGEWQKIALARAFFREAQVLILDEPTASLDALAEYEMYQKFHELTRGRTTLLISHRFSTVRMADRIYVMEKGRIGEEGTHEELMAYGGRYAQMFTLQAEPYRDR